MAEAETTRPPVLSPEDVAAQLEDGQTQLVDVRTDQEHEAGRIAGARHIPIERLSSEADQQLDRNRTLVLYCHAGDRSGTAAEAFRSSGWEAYSLEGGIAAWEQAGRPVEGEVVGKSGLPPR